MFGSAAGGPKGRGLRVVAAAAVLASMPLVARAATPAVSAADEPERAAQAPSTSRPADATPAAAQPLAQPGGDAQARVYWIGEAYEDQYLDLSPQPDPPAAAESGFFSGRHFLSAEYRAQQLRRDAGLPQDEQGVLLLGTQETENYGKLRLDAVWSDRRERGEEEVPQHPIRSEAEATALLVQEGFPLNRAWVLDQSLGDQQSRTSPLLSVGARVVLPSSLMRGYSVRLQEGQQAFRLSAGQLGQYRGFNTRGFEVGSGELYALHWEHGEAGTTGTQLAAHLGGLRNHDEVPDHEVAGFAWRRRLGMHRGWRGNLLYSEGRVGVWSEAEHPVAAWRHRLGLFYLEPDLRWHDAQLSVDRQGLHWRADMLNQRRSLALGFDLEQTDVTEDPLRPQRRIFNAFANGSRALSLRTRAGATLGYSRSEPRDGIGERIGSEGATLFLNRRSAMGTSHVQLGYSGLRTGALEAESRSLSWDHAWPALLQVHFGTTLGAEWVRSGGDRGERHSAGIYARGTLGRRLRFTGDVNWRGGDRLGLHTDAQRIQDVSTGASGALFWTPLPEWELGLSGHLNRVQTDVLEGTEHRDSRVLVTLRWTDSGGRGLSALGRHSGIGGTGRITGVVYHDANGDGMRNPGEPAFPGLFVYLDGRTAARTDAEGRFSFAPVFSGDHRLTVALEDLPLPFVPAEEDVLVEVAPRGVAEADIRILTVEQ